jgi:hypothetical protein
MAALDGSINQDKECDEKQNVFLHCHRLSPKPRGNGCGHQWLPVF